MAETGIEPVALGGSDVVVVPRADLTGNLSGYGILNLTEREQHVTLPAGGTDLLTGDVTSRGVTLEPLAVRIIAME